MSETDASYSDEMFEGLKEDLNLGWTPSMSFKNEEKDESPKFVRMKNIYEAAKKATKLSMLLLGDEADEKHLETMARKLMREGNKELSKLFDKLGEIPSEDESSEVEDKPSEAEETYNDFSLSKIILEDKKEVEIFLRHYPNKNKNNDDEDEKAEKTTYCARVDNMKLHWEYASMEQLFENFEKDCCVDIPKGTGEQLKEWWEHFQKMDEYSEDWRLR